MDQPNDFELVQRHISDVGGDPANITAFGAGSGSLHIHILSGKAIFDRTILMSGSCPIMGPLPLQLLEKGWKTLFEAAETSAKTPEERLEELRSLSQDDIMQKFGPRTTFSPLGDGKFLLTSWRLGDPHPDSRCAGIIIGNVGIEGIVFDALTLLLPKTIFNKSILSAFKRASDAELFCKKKN